MDAETQKWVKALFEHLDEVEQGLGDYLATMKQQLNEIQAEVEVLASKVDELDRN